MPRRASGLEVWLFTDPRLGDAAAVAAAARRVPPGGGIVVRHDGLAPGARTRLVRSLRAVARARRCVLVVAGAPRAARAAGADGVHLRDPKPARARAAHAHALMVTVPVHDRRQARLAELAGADRLFVSPVHPTRSHHGIATLGARGLAVLMGGRQAGGVALGGMDAGAARGLRRRGVMIAGWAAIDALGGRVDRGGGGRAGAGAARQKRNCVPTNTA